MARGISSGTLGIVIVAIVAGLIGAYVVRTSLLKEPEPVAKAPARLTVPLAAADLPAGRTLTLGDIGLMSMTSAEMEAQGFLLNQTMMAPEQIIGRTLREPVKQGQPFLTTALYLEGTRQDYTAELTPGYRAISMPIAKERGGALPSGSMVDVFFRSTERKPAGTNDRGIPEMTLQLLQGIKIIDVYEPPVPAASRSAGLDIRNLNSSRTPPPPLVTLAVTPEQAQILQTASGRGELTLVARPENERLAGATPLRGKTLDDLLGIEPPPQVVVFATEAYRRGSRSVNVYRDDRLVEQLRATTPPANNNGAAVDVPATDKPVPAPPFAPPAGNDNADPVAPPPSAAPPATPPQPPAAAPANGDLGLQRPYVPMTAGTSR